PRCKGLFFFQAEDGIRDRTVTGVQTCALPIYESALRPRCPRSSRRRRGRETMDCGRGRSADSSSARRRRTRACSACRVRRLLLRSEERRVGKEGRCGRWAVHEKKIKDGE